MPVVVTAKHVTLAGAGDAVTDYTFNQAASIEVYNRSATTAWFTIKQGGSAGVTPTASADDSYIVPAGAAREIKVAGLMPCHVRVLATGDVSITRTA